MADYTNDPRVEVLAKFVMGVVRAVANHESPPTDSMDFLAALDAVDPARQWRPIEEAPRDGSSVLGYVEGCVPFVTWYDHPGFEGMPTHFLPLPAPPEAA